MAAALAHAAVAFADSPRLSSAYWHKAQLAYELTGVEQGCFGNSNDAYSVLRQYYPSSGVVSHVFYAAASMLLACRELRCEGEARYERQALALAATREADGGQKWYWEVLRCAHRALSLHVRRRPVLGGSTSRVRDGMQVPSWDNAWWEGAAIMAGLGFEGPQIDHNPAFKHFLASFAEKWTQGLPPVT